MRLCERVFLCVPYLICPSACIVCCTASCVCVMVTRFVIFEHFLKVSLLPFFFGKVPLGACTFTPQLLHTFLAKCSIAFRLTLANVYNSVRTFALRYFARPVCPSSIFLLACCCFPLCSYQLATTLSFEPISLAYPVSGASLHVHFDRFPPLLLAACSLDAARCMHPRFSSMCDVSWVDFPGCSVWVTVSLSISISLSGLCARILIFCCRCMRVFSQR